MLIYIVFIAQIFTLTPLKEQEYDYHLKNQHIFIVACREDSEQCEKVKNDFEDIWDDFNYKNVSNFPSKLFQISRNINNKDFYDNIVEQTYDFVLVYIEHKNETFKKFLNPLISSSRKIKGWMKIIENQFADKIIDQKIEQLDKLINGPSKDDTQNTQVQQVQKIDTEKKIDETKKQKDDDKKIIKNDDLDELQQELNKEEDQTQKRQLNVNDLNVDSLDETEEKQVLTFFDKKMKQLNDQNIILQKRITDTQQNQNQQNLDKKKIQDFKQQQKENRQQKKEEIKQRAENIKFEDIDLSRLNKEEIEKVKSHFAELDKQRQKNLEIAKQELTNGTKVKVLPSKPKLSPTQPIVSFQKPKNNKIQEIKNQQQIIEEPKVESIQVRQSLYSMWIYFATFMIFMIFALKLVLFYKKKEFSRVKRYEDLEEQGIFVAEIQLNQLIDFILFKFRFLSNFSNLFLQIKYAYNIMQQDYYKQSLKSNYEQIENTQFDQAQQVIKEFLSSNQDDLIKKAMANLLKYYKGTIVQLKDALTQAMQKIERYSNKEKQSMKQIYEIQQRLQNQQNKLVVKLAEKDQQNQSIKNELNILQEQLQFSEEQIQQKNQSIQELQKILDDKDQLQNLSLMDKKYQQNYLTQIKKLQEENEVYIQENKILQQKFENQDKQISHDKKLLKQKQNEISHLNIQNEAFQKKIAELSALNIQYKTQINELNKTTNIQSMVQQQNYQTPKKEHVYQYQDENQDYQNIQNNLNVENIFSNKRDNTKELIYGSSNKRQKNILSFPAHKTIENNQDEISRLNSELDQLLIEKNKIQGQISRIPINLKKMTEIKQKNSLEDTFEKIQEKILATKNKLKKYKYQLQQIKQFLQINIIFY